MSNEAQDHEARMEVSEITENIYVGESMCCTGHKEYHEQRLSELGMFADIDLRKEYDEAPHKLEVHMKLPVVDTFPPSPMQTKAGVDLIDTVVKDGKKIYIHCQVGHGRSPTLAAAYFILKKGMSAMEAVDFVKNRRSEAHPTDRQLEFLDLLEKSR